MTVVPTPQRGAVLRAYNWAVTRTFYICLAVALLGLVAALCMEWKSVKGPKTPEDKEAQLAQNKESTA